MKVCAKKSYTTCLIMTSAALLGQVTLGFDVLKSNIIEWEADIPTVQFGGARDKKWKLTGQTGWFKDANE